VADNVESASETSGPSALIKAVERQFDRLFARRPEPGLYLVATPIGNLGDVGIRALATLAQCDAIYCEDTRRTRILLDHYGIEVPLRSYHEHNAARERPAILAKLAAGERIGLVSDAGTPLVSDPGYKLVRAAIDDGHGVFAIPGASAVLAALTASGLPTDQFVFAGFLPNKSAARRTRLGELACLGGSIVLFETAPRVAASLADAADVLGGERPAVVARELTKLHEAFARGSLADLAGTIGEPQGEIVVVIGPATEPAAVDDETIDARLRGLLSTTSVKDAARQVAEEFQIGRSRAYERALALKTAGETS
jgi:16S rRNA (cytidine1402-2'-O)-methyltransferase